MGFRDDAYWHAIHAWKEITAEGRGKLTNLDFVETLVSDEILVFLFLERPERVIPSGRKVWIGGVCPRPKAFAERIADRSNERHVRMSREELFKAVNVDGCNDGEKRRMTLNGIECSEVIKFVRRRSWYGRQVKGNEGESRTWLKILFCPDQVSDILGS
jgi:hypothetical protein